MGLFMAFSVLWFALVSLRWHGLPWHPLRSGAPRGSSAFF
jgi:hypothetical protein